MHLKVENLNKTIGKTTILNNINFEICSNGVVGLLGPNGAGKSSLMKILVGLWNFNNGIVQYHFNQEHIFSQHNCLPHSVVRHIGYLPENNPLYDDMYVREYLQFTLSLLGIKHNIRKNVTTLIDTVGLTPMADKRIGQLSKGYRQRVGIAQAIAGNPELLILDEPTTGLDPNQLDEIRTLIKQLGNNHIILLSTHILQEVEAMCNRVIILANSQICEDTRDLNNLEQLFRDKTKQVSAI